MASIRRMDRTGEWSLPLPANEIRSDLPAQVRDAITAAEAATARRRQISAAIADGHKLVRAAQAEDFAARADAAHTGANDPGTAREDAANAAQLQAHKDLPFAHAVERAALQRVQHAVISGGLTLLETLARQCITATKNAQRAIDTAAGLINRRESLRQLILWCNAVRHDAPPPRPRATDDWVGLADRIRSRYSGQGGVEHQFVSDRNGRTRAAEGDAEPAPAPPVGEELAVAAAATGD